MTKKITQKAEEKKTQQLEKVTNKSTKAKRAVDSSKQNRKIAADDSASVGKTKHDAKPVKIESVQIK